MDTLAIEDFSAVVDEIYTKSSLFKEPIRVADTAVSILYTYMHAADLSQVTPLVKAACHYIANALNAIVWFEADDFTYNYKVPHDENLDDMVAVITTTLQGQLIIPTPINFLRRYEIRGDLPAGAWDAMRVLMRDERTYTYQPDYFADAFISQLQAGKKFEWPTMMEDTKAVTQLKEAPTDLASASPVGEGAFGKVVAFKGYAYKTSDLLMPAVVELAALRRCKHPNVLEVLGFGYKRDYDEYDNISTVTTVLRLPLAKGTLSEQLSTSRPKSARRQWARDIFNGLAHIHRQGILHGDIKPDNILVMEDGRLVIADFGVSEAFYTEGDHDTSHNNEKSTMHYRDINLLNITDDNGYSQLGQEVDVWAAALVLVDIERGRMITRDYIEVSIAVSEWQSAELMKTYGKDFEELTYKEQEKAYRDGVISHNAVEIAWRQFLLDEIVGGKITGKWEDRYHASVVQSIFVVDRHLRPSAAAIVAVL